MNIESLHVKKEGKIRHVKRNQESMSRKGTGRRNITAEFKYHSTTSVELKWF